MKISTKGEYGLRAMLYLAMHTGEGPVTSREIAAHQSIPEPYLRQILARLSRKRLIRSNRGPQGGHVLGRPACDISLRDILTTLEGETTSVDHILTLPCNIEIGPKHCAIREQLLEVKLAVERILAHTSLEDLSNRQLEILERKIEVPHDLEPEQITALPVVGQ